LSEVERTPAREPRSCANVSQENKRDIDHESRWICTLQLHPRGQGQTASISRQADLRRIQHSIPDRRSHRRRMGGPCRGAFLFPPPPGAFFFPVSFVTNAGG